MEDPASCCIIWQQALEEAGFEYPDLTAREFLLTHNLLKQSGNTCSFRSIQVLASLEQQYNRVKGWSLCFFFLFGKGWEFPVGQANRCDYPIQVVGDNKSFRPSVTPEEVS